MHAASNRQVMISNYLLYATAGITIATCVVFFALFVGLLVRWPAVMLYVNSGKLSIEAARAYAEDRFSQYRTRVKTDIDRITDTVTFQSDVKRVECCLVNVALKAIWQEIKKGACYTADFFKGVWNDIKKIWHWIF